MWLAILAESLNAKQRILGLLSLIDPLHNTQRPPVRLSLVALPAPVLELALQLALVLGRRLAVLLAHPHRAVLAVEPHAHHPCGQQGQE
jgi:hypothetical protein